MATQRETILGCALCLVFGILLGYSMSNSSCANQSYGDGGDRNNHDNRRKVGGGGGGGGGGDSAAMISLQERLDNVEARLKAGFTSSAQSYAKSAFGDVENFGKSAAAAWDKHAKAGRGASVAQSTHHHSLAPLVIERLGTPGGSGCQQYGSRIAHSMLTQGLEEIDNAEATSILAGGALYERALFYKATNATQDYFVRATGKKSPLNLIQYRRELERKAFENNEQLGKMRTFRQIGDGHIDDKTWNHFYQNGYEAYFEAHRHRSHELNGFEIGLGCDQKKGLPGASARLWSEYLPDMRLSMMEFNAKCARQWERWLRGNGTITRGGFKIYPGDQSSESSWRDILEKEDAYFQRKTGDNSARAMYDFIIDDGSHKVQHQLLTFLMLWPRIKPGGVYVIEDINTSFRPGFYGGVNPPSPTSATAISLVNALLQRVHTVPLAKSGPGMLLEDYKRASPVFRVDCFHFVCFISKKFQQ